MRQCEGPGKINYLTAARVYSHHPPQGPAGVYPRGPRAWPLAARPGSRSFSHARVRRDRARERWKVLGLIEDMNANRFTIFRSLTLPRQLSLHAVLIDDPHQDLPSSKIDALLGQLREVAGGGHRALVFSQFTRFLGNVRGRLDAEGMQYCYLDGKTATGPRCCSAARAARLRSS